MKVGRFLLVTAMLGALLASARMEPLDPRLGQRMFSLMRNSDADPEQLLASLEDLADNWRRRPEQHAYVVNEQAGVLVRLERHAEARELIEEALDGKLPGFAPMLDLTLGRILLLLEETEAAAASIERWRANEEQPSAQGLFLLGYAYVTLERFEIATPMLEEAIGAVPLPRSAWIELLAYVYSRTGRAEQAVALVEDLITTDPARARRWRLLATIYQLMDAPGRGAAALAVSGEIETLSFTELKYLSRMLAHLEMPYDAALLLDAGIARAADDAEGTYRDYMLLARLWMFAREFDLAVEALGRAVSLSEDGEPALLLGQMYLHWERYPEAITALEQAVAGYGEDAPANAYYLLAVAATNLDRPEEARRALLQIEADKNYTERVRTLMRHLDEGSGPPGDED